MATYTELSYGSSGSEVKKLQEALNQNGASLDVDGIFGSLTDAAVRNYQSSKGLAVDGIAGNKTLSSLYGSTTTPSANASTTPATSTTDTAENVAEETPVASSPTYEEQLKDLYNQITNMPSFSYDPSSDALYQQYANQYASLGQNAMEDTMGQAAALTGGYGSTYAQNVGQQAYNSYMQQLAGMIPELENQAYDRYKDNLSTLYNNIGYLQDASDREYERQNDMYERLVSLMTTTGYSPTEDELTGSGMTQAQADAYKKYYTDSLYTASSGGSGGSSSGGGGGYSYSSSNTGSTSSNTSSTPTSSTQSTADNSTLYNNAVSQVKSILTGSAHSKANAVKIATDYTTGTAWYRDKTTGEVHEESYYHDNINAVSGQIKTYDTWKNSKEGFSSYEAYLNAVVAVIKQNYG